MKELDPEFIESKNQQTVAPIKLFTFHNYDELNSNLYFAGYPEDVVFDGITYVKFPISIAEVTENSGGEVDEIKITLSNVSRQIEAILQNPSYKLKGKKITITIVFADKLDQPDCKYQESFYIDYFQSNARNVEFVLSTRLDVCSVIVPGRTVIRTHCSWVFKGEDCKYAGAESSCNRTLQRCRQLENTLNYGGFPAAGGKRMFV